MNEIVQHSVKDIWQMASIIAKSRLFGVKTVEEAASLMLIAQAEGLHPAVAARDYHIIQGRPCLKADAMLARFQQAGGICQWECVTDAKVSALFSHPTKSPKPVLIEWTNETVKQAKISSDMHLKYPRQMKRARVISEGVRTTLPECVCGVYAPEEIATKAAEIEEMERDAAEHIKPADVTIPDTPSPFNDDGGATVPTGQPEDREVIIHFNGKGQPPTKKAVSSCSDEELAKALDVARDRYKKANGKYAEKNKAEAQADAEAIKIEAARRTEKARENAPSTPESSSEAKDAPEAPPAPENAPEAKPDVSSIEADVLTATTMIFVKMIGSKPHKKCLKDMDQEDMALAYDAAQHDLTSDDRAKVARAKGVIALIDAHRAGK